MREFEKGNIFSNIIYLAWPALLINILQNILSAFDMFLLGKIGVKALSAISIAGILLSFFWSIEGGLITGAIAIVSRYAGEKKYKLLNSSIVNMLITAFMLGVVYSFVMYVFLEPILKFFGARGETLIKTEEYFILILPALINIAVFFIFFAVLRALGYLRTPLFLMIAGIITNFILEPIFILGLFGCPKLGIKGAALAYLLSYIIPNIIAIIIFLRGKGNIKINLKYMTFDFTEWLLYIKVSLPAMMQGLLSNFASLIMLKIISKFGDTFIAAYGIGSRLDVFVMMIGWAIGSSISIMVGHNIGAGELKRANDSVNIGIKIYSIFTLLCFVLFFNFSEYLVKFFNSDLSVIRYGSLYLRIISPFYLLLGIGIITGMAFNGAGKTQIAMVINIIAFFIFQIPASVLLPFVSFISEKGIFIGIALAYAFQGLGGWIIFKKQKWMTFKKII